MPLIHIVVSGPAPEAATIRRLQQETTQLMQGILRKEAALTVVNVAHLPGGAGAANGEPVAATASLQAMITAGTNSAEEKADFIAAATALLRAVNGPSAAPVYVVLHEIPAASWGYDGLTQAARRAGQGIGGGA